MGQYILKSALAAEIEKIKNTEYNGNSISDDVACCALDMVIEAINTLEVKEMEEVDINKVCKFLDGYSFIPTYIIKKLKNEFSKGE